MSDRITKAQIKWVRSLQQKKNRDEQGLFVADENFLVNFAMCRKFSFVEIPS
jgi:hypothetical protein